MYGSREIPDGRRSPQWSAGMGKEIIRKPIRYAAGKSDSCVVSKKWKNNGPQPMGHRPADSMERRHEAKGNSAKPTVIGTQRPAIAKSGFSQDTGNATSTFVERGCSASDPRQEPYEGNPHVRICAGGVPGNRHPYRDLKGLLPQKYIVPKLPQQLVAKSPNRQTCRWNSEFYFVCFFLSFSQLAQRVVICRH